MTVIKISKNAFEALLPLGAIGNASQEDLENGVFKLQNQVPAATGVTIDLSKNADDNGRAAFKYESDTKKVKVGIRTLLFMNVITDVTKPEDTVPLHTIIGNESEDDIELPSEFTVVAADIRKNDDDEIVFPAYMYAKFQEAVDALEEGEEIGTLYQDRELTGSLPGTDFTASWMKTSKKMEAEKPKSFSVKYASKSLRVTLPQ